MRQVFGATLRCCDREARVVILSHGTRGAARGRAIASPRATPAT
jgi:hypothetical protein